MPMKRIVRMVVVGAVAASLASLTSCFPFDRRGAAEDLDQRIRAMPGVERTMLTYNAGIDAGKNFSLTVTLAPSATTQEAVNVGTTFVRDRIDDGLGDHDGSLSLTYPSAEDTGDAVRNESRASFDFGPKDGAADPTEQQVADGISLWSSVRNSPVVNIVEVSEPSRRGEPEGPNVTVLLKLDADAEAVAQLQRTTPGLQTASWEYAVPYDSPVYRRSYVSTPNPPSASDMALWTEISGVNGPYYDAKGTTRPMTDGSQAVTSVEIDIQGTHPETLAAVPRISRAVAALLPRFGHPAQLVVRGSEERIELVVGGCYRHDAGYVATPLESELSRQYEKC